MYAVYHGPVGLTNIAKRVHFMSQILQSKLTEMGFNVISEDFFDTVTIKVDNADKLLSAFE